MDKVRQIFFRREYGGFLIGGIAMLIAIELVEPCRALVICLLVFGGLSLTRKFLN